MDCILQTLASAIIAALVLLAARRFGQRAAGVLAGLPLSTAPALGWIAGRGNDTLAIRTAIGSIAGCMLVPLFAIAYGSAARRGWWSALSAGVVAVALGGAVASTLVPAPWLATTLCALGSAVAWCILERRDGQRSRVPAASTATSIAASAVFVGMLGSAVAWLTTVTTPQFAGMLAGLPTLGLVALAGQHREHGPACVGPFLRGYVASTLGRALFGAVFASMVSSVGSTAAMAAAMLVDVVFCLAASGAMGCLERQRTSHAEFRSRGRSVLSKFRPAKIIMKLNTSTR